MKKQLRTSTSKTMKTLKVTMFIEKHIVCICRSLYNTD